MAFNNIFEAYKKARSNTVKTQSNQDYLILIKLYSKKVVSFLLHVVQLEERSG